MAMTYTPGEGVNADGSTFTDANSGSFQRRSGGQSVDAVKITNEVTGEEEWDYEVENYQEETEGFNEEEYIDAIVASTPQLSYALAWAKSGGLTEQQIQDYDNAIESDDLDVLNKAVEDLMNAFYQENPDAALEEEDEVEQEPITQEEIDGAVETLTTNEAGGTSIAYEFLQAAEQAKDPVERQLLMWSADFHRGEQEASYLVQRAIDEFGFAKVAPFVKRLLG